MTVDAYDAAFLTKLILNHSAFSNQLLEADRCLLKHPLEPVNGLPSPVFVFHQGKSNIRVTILPKPDPRGDGDLCLIEEELRKFQRPHAQVRLGDLRPDEHGPLLLRDRPPDPVQSIYQHITTYPVGLHRLPDAGLRAVQRNNRCDLYRLKHAVIQIALEPRQSRNDPRVPDAEPDPPTRHIVALGERKELHRDLLCPGDLQEAWRLVR